MITEKFQHNLAKNNAGYSSQGYQDTLLSLLASKLNFSTWWTFAFLANRWQNRRWFTASPSLFFLAVYLPNPSLEMSISIYFFSSSSSCFPWKEPNSAGRASARRLGTHTGACFVCWYSLSLFPSSTPLDNEERPVPSKRRKEERFQKKLCDGIGYCEAISRTETEARRLDHVRLVGWMDG